MPLYYIEHECNGQTERSSEGVDCLISQKPVPMPSLPPRYCMISYQASAANAHARCATLKVGA